MALSNYRSDLLLEFWQALCQTLCGRKQQTSTLFWATVSQESEAMCCPSNQELAKIRTKLCLSGTAGPCFALADVMNFSTEHRVDEVGAYWMHIMKYFSIWFILLFQETYWQYIVWFLFFSWFVQVCARKHRTSSQLWLTTRKSRIDWNAHQALLQNQLPGWGFAR